MVRKGMLSLFSPSSHHHSRPSFPPPSPHRQTFSATLMEDNISTAESIIIEWDPNTSNSNVTSLFYDTRDKARRFLRAVDDLQRAMVFFSSDDCLESPDSRSHALIRAQTLMQSAMRRLEKEFYQILSSNRDCLDPESLYTVRSPRSSVSDPDSEDEIRTASDSIGEVERSSAIAMADLRSIAQTMISAGYGKECVRIYKILRKSIVDKGLNRLGFENLTLSQIQKLDWDVLDLKIRSWLGGSVVAVKTLFTGERILCDHVFDVSDSIRESCFAEITKDAAVQFLGFPEIIAKSKRSPEKLFRILDMYNSISDLWLEIESVFSFESTSAVRSQALTSLLKLADAARSTLSEFESAIQKDASRSPVRGGGVHQLTRYVMNYIVFLADYEIALADIYADFPLQMPSPLPESFFDSSTISTPSSPSSFEGSPRSSISVRIAWLILVLLCKLDGKAEVYREVALSYLFLANNLQYMVNKVRESNLRLLLREDWVAKHERKARNYAASYERFGWAKVAAAIPSLETAAAAAERIRVFNEAFEKACRVQKEWLVADGKMRDEVRASVTGLILPAYRAFYLRYRPVLSAGVPGVLRELSAVRFAPEDVRDRLMELFSGSVGSGGSGLGSNHGSNKSSWWSTH